MKPVVCNFHSKSSSIWTALRVIWQKIFKIPSGIFIKMSASNSTFFISLLLPGRGAKYCSQCVFFCMSDDNISKTQIQILLNFPKVACGRGSVLLWWQCNTLYNSSLPPVWMMSCFHIMEQIGQTEDYTFHPVHRVVAPAGDQTMLVTLATWQHWWQSLLSLTACCCVIIIIITHEITPQSQHCSMMKLWRHQAVNPFAARPEIIYYHQKQWKTANTAGNIISYTTVISIAYLASPDLCSSLGIIIYFLLRKYPACKAAKGLRKYLVECRVFFPVSIGTKL